MSPIPSLATSALSNAIPSVAPDSGSSRQSSPPMTHYLLGTGGLLLAMAAIVSVAGHLFGRRGMGNVRTTNASASLTGWLSYFRHQGSTLTPTAPETNWPVLPVHPDHANMVYARFFHPTFWNFVEHYPATTSAPAIYVEEEATEVPMADPKPFGMNSFLDVDDDDGEGEGVGTAKNHAANTREKLDGGESLKVKVLPPYDTSLAISINFVSEVIGTTVRQGAFLSVVQPRLEDHQEDEADDSDSDPESDFDDSTYDAIVTTITALPYSNRRHGIASLRDFSPALNTIPEEGRSLVSTVSFCSGLVDVTSFEYADPDPAYSSPERGSHMGSSSKTSKCELAFQEAGGCMCQPGNGNENNVFEGTAPLDLDDSGPNASSSSLESLSLSPGTDSDVFDEGSTNPSTPQIDTSNSYFDSDCSPYDGIVVTPPTSPSVSRRHGIADMSYFAQSLKSAIQQESSYFIPATASRTELGYLKSPTTHLEFPDVADGSTAPTFSVGARLHPDQAQNSSSDVNAVPAHEEGLKIMQSILTELRDPSLNMHCTPRSLEEDVDFGNDGDEPTLPYPGNSAGRPDRNADHSLRPPYSDNDSYEEKEIDDRSHAIMTELQAPSIVQPSAQFSDDGMQEVDGQPLKPPDDFHDDYSVSLTDFVMRISGNSPNSDVSAKSSNDPVTPPSKNVPDIRNDHTAAHGFGEGSEVVLPTLFVLPPAFPTRAHLQTFRDSQSFRYGSR